MSTRADVLRERMSALNSGRCASVTNEDAKAYCPEVFLDVVADKLAGTAVQFINVSLTHTHTSPRICEHRIAGHRHLLYEREADLVDNHALCCRSSCSSSSSTGYVSVLLLRHTI